MSELVKARREEWEDHLEDFFCEESGQDCTDWRLRAKFPGDSNPSVKRGIRKWAGDSYNAREVFEVWFEGCDQTYALVILEGFASGVAEPVVSKQRTYGGGAVAKSEVAGLSVSELMKGGPQAVVLEFVEGDGKVDMNVLKMALTFFVAEANSMRAQNAKLLDTVEKLTNRIPGKYSKLVDDMGRGYSAVARVWEGQARMENARANDLQKTLSDYNFKVKAIEGMKEIVQGISPIIMSQIGSEKPVEEMTELELLEHIQKAMDIHDKMTKNSDAPEPEFEEGGEE